MPYCGAVPVHVWCGVRDSVHNVSNQSGEGGDRENFSLTALGHSRTLSDTSAGT